MLEEQLLQKAKKQRNYSKKYAKKIKSNNFTRSNREMTNIAIWKN